MALPLAAALGAGNVDGRALRRGPLVDIMISMESVLVDFESEVVVL